jgi:hypothetical protein
MAFSNLEKALLLKLGIDVARNPVSRAAVKTAVTMVGRQAVAPTASLGLGLARRNPLAATGLGLLAAEQAGLLEPLEQPFEQAVRAVDEAVVQAPARRRKKQRTAFNRAVSEGMKAVKKSASYGKKGTINNARKAFTQVTKVASKLNKGKKVSPKGPTGVIKRAITRFFPKKKPVRRRQSKKIDITVNR